MRRIAACIIMMFICLCAVAQWQVNIDSACVRLSVHFMLERYPRSTLQDIYKSFFQDRFGPGHMVDDTVRVAAYMRKELELVEDVNVLLYEQVGYMGNYYRVALAAVAAGRVEFNDLLSAFLRSVRAVDDAEVVAWTAEWRQIEGVISSMQLSLPDYEADSRAIDELLSAGHYSVHHSKVFNLHYAPHYRIIAKDIFEKEILPLLNKD